MPDKKKRMETIKNKMGWMARLFLIIFFASISKSYGQDLRQEFRTEELTYSEFLGYVKKYHPMVKQANLEVSRAEALLMQARGGFDPKIEVDYSKKEFKGTEYYSLLNSSFKIPTWYGIEVKAGFDDTDGSYFNPQNRTPEAGLTSLGISVPLGQGLFINQRMADVRSGKLQFTLSDAERKLMAIEVLYKASEAYFEWRRCFNEAVLYRRYLGFASTRFEGIKKLIELGDSPAIDSVEARITVRNRELNVENGNLKLAKAALHLANYLWIENVPVELNADIMPEENLMETLGQTLRTDTAILVEQSLGSHPKMTALQTKLSILEIDRKLKANLLLPKLNVGYNYISEPVYLDAFNTGDYKFNIDFSIPIFLRKERGSLKIAKLKIQDLKFDIDQQRLELANKIKAQQAEIVSLKKQKGVIDDLVQDYRTMLDSEERLFSFGESSMFLINSRENNLVSAKLSQIAIENQYYISSAQLYRILANPD
jgi:outer membrane protein TolC